MRTLLLFTIASLSVLLSGCAFLGVGHIDEHDLEQKYKSQYTKTINYKGTVLNYSKEGSGPSVVLLHGVLSSLNTWDEWAESLKKNYTVYRIDLPGFGFSSLPESPKFYDKNAFVPLLDELFEQMELEKFHIVGSSLGGYVAWNYALENPEKVKSLTVIDPASYTHKMPALLRLVANPVLGSVSRIMMPKPIIDFGISQVYADASRVPESTKQRYFDLLMREGNRDNFVDIMQWLSKHASEPGLGNGIKNIRVPTLVMWGEEDRWIPVSMAYRWKEDLSDAELIVYPGVGHVPMEETPARTVHDYQQFIQRH